MDGHVLAGITVLDVGSWIAGPAAATVMSDFGAEVIKVEPPGGDPYRDFYHVTGAPASDINYPWLLDARNKKSVVLDLAIREARDALLALVARADVFLTNQPPARIERLRLGYGELSAVNPRLVYASLTGYGDEGEEANKLGFDINAWWARSGLMDVVRAPGAPPAGSVPGMGDHPSAMTLFGAIMLALYQRERTGRGAKVSSSLLSNGAWANAILIQAALSGATFVPRPPRERALNALLNLYRCRDGRWFTLTLLREEREWGRLARAVGREELLTDARFATMSARHANSTALVKVLDEVFAGRDWPEWRRILEAHRITFGPMARITEPGDDRQMVAAETIVPLEIPERPGMRTVMSPIQVSGQSKVPPRRAPELGEHTREVLRSVGYDDAALQRLRAAGALG
ncbi:MAG: carnitine dehydratase [Candidatus Rokuibacteriota bacterium]|nr:MAG: carnitine dehydratase [Candidatus Rokubacteria bacterium]